MKKSAAALVACLLLFAGLFHLHAQTDSGYFRSFDGTRIYYQVKGRGMPVVLVHGFIVNGESWKRMPLYNALLDSGYQIISMDLRGNGRSDKPHVPEAYENDAEAKDIMGLLDSLKVTQYCAIGYSRGSIITARLMVLDKRLHCAVIGGMGDGFTNPQWPRRLMFYRALSGEPVPELEGMVKYVKESGLDQIALAYLQKAQPSTSPEVLVTLYQPVLVISGDNDPDNGSPSALAKMLPSSTFRVVPGDHNNTPRSVAFSTEVLDFLAKNYGR